MKKIFLLILSLVLLINVFESSCKYKEKELPYIDKKLIIEEIETSIKEFQKLDSNLKADDFHQYAINIHRISNFIFSSEILNSVVEDSVEIFFLNIRHSGIFIDDSQIEKTLRLPFETFKDKILLYEYISIQRLLHIYKNSFFLYKMIKIVPVPQKSVVKIGEELQVNFHIVGINENYKRNVVIGDDTLENKEGTIIPNYSFFPTKKGNDTLRGYMINTNLIINNFVFPFEMPYKVE